ncbi:MAG: type II secretion system F family protein [Planctomycetes bacterium]|nr:type II secretion system F family protein [Planctomycetota bacterium]
MESGNTTLDAPVTGTAVAAEATSDRDPVPQTLDKRWRKRAKIPKREIANLTSQLAIMTRTGMDVTSALQSLVRQISHPVANEVLQCVHDDVMAGKSFSQALHPFAHVFGTTYVASVSAGESSGRMGEVLGHLAQLQRRELRLQSTIRTLMAYPVLLMSVASLVIMAMVLFVLPQFAKVFENFDTPLPALTQILINVSMELRTRYWLWGPLFCLVVAGLIAFRHSRPGRRLWDRFLLNAPLVRSVTRPLYIGRVCRMMGIMIQSGVPLLDCLRLSKGAVGNSLYQELFSELEVEVTNGRGLGTVLMESEFVPSSAAEMVQTAEQTGSIGIVTEMIGEHYEEEGETKLRDFVTVLEPAITVGMGAIVAVVVMAVMLPMFEMGSFARQN